MPPAQRQACLDRGGTVEGRGMMGMETCVIRYKDAGKPCRDRKDCEGLCLAPAEGNGLGPARCQAENHRFGCYAEVDNGKADGPALCVD